MMTPASIRNNNPGAIYPGRSARKFGGTTGETLQSKDGKHPIVKFPTAIHGAAALFDNFMNAKGATGYYYRGRTLAQAIDTWCGSIRSQSYLRLIEQQAGFKPSEILSVEFLRDPDKAVQLAKAMARHEAGKDYPLSPNEWLEAHTMAFSGGHVAPEPSPNNDVPTMRPEARFAALKARVMGWLGVGGATSGGAVGLVGPPDLSQVAAWRSATDQVADMANWTVTNWKLALCGCAAYGIVAHVIPNLPAIKDRVT